MNFVIFSRNFYPQNDPEAFCTTRFVSALAAAGHIVHVVTAEYDCDFDYRVLVDERVKITRVRAPRKQHRFPSLNIRQAMVMDDDMWNVPAFCRVVKDVLKQYDKPILISRAMPFTSALVGYRVRKYAYKWISHFSDPIPWFPLTRKVLRMRDWLTRRWMRKIIAAADAVSVTCPLAVRYYQETYPEACTGKKFFVALHIGDTKLNQQKRSHGQPLFARQVILHPGDMYYGRGDAVFKAVDLLNEQGTPCVFVLDRPPIMDMVHWFRESRHAISLGVRGGGLVNDDIRMSAGVVFIPDFVREFDYSPYLMSKFAYQIYGDRPIVVYAKRESCMADYCRRYPEAGLFFSEAGDVDSLVSALKQALACDASTIRRDAIRIEFAAETVARKFIDDVVSLLSSD